MACIYTSKFESPRYFDSYTSKNLDYKLTTKEKINNPVLMWQFSKENSKEENLRSYE